jgi:hypothetical protein
VPPPCRRSCVAALRSTASPVSVRVAPRAQQAAVGHAVARRRGQHKVVLEPAGRLALERGAGDPREAHGAVARPVGIRREELDARGGGLRGGLRLVGGSGSGRLAGRGGSGTARFDDCRESFDGGSQLVQFFFDHLLFHAMESKRISNLNLIRKIAHRCDNCL